MIPEIGYFTLILALLLSIIQFTIPMIGVYRHKMHWMQMARPLSLGVCFFISLSLLCLLYAFIYDDFSLAYVVQHSNTHLALKYKISAIWAGHEGSMLLWTFIMSIWTVFFSLRSRDLPLWYSASTLSLLSLLILGFLVFLLGLSNPFLRFLPDFPIDGSDLNPLLQDPGLIIHPPVLYMGYIGLAIPFVMSLALLLNSGKDDSITTNALASLVMRSMRLWVLIPWSFLALGIALGSWWAYYELGWGGWWFWDPVENVSLMPWLVSTALIHSLMVSDKKKLYYPWSLGLALLSFLLSILGTFLVRSGLLSSVHAFANDPKRGMYLFVFLFLITSFSVTIYVLKIKFFLKNTKSNQMYSTSLLSRESFILIGSTLLLIATLAILLGTLVPVITDKIMDQKISIDYPYFNAVFIPLIMPVLLLVPVGPLSFWGSNPLTALWKLLRITLLLSSVFTIATCAILFYLYPDIMPLPIFIGLFAASWIILGTIKSAISKIKKRGGLFKLSSGAVGMLLAHAGVGVCIIGITIVSHYQLEKEFRIAKNETVHIGAYQIQFADIKHTEGSNYIGYQAHFKAKLSDKPNSTINLYPEKRTFVVQELTMTETAIDWGWFRDLDIALGEKLDTDHWSVHIYYKPLIRWIWLGALMMAVGGLFAGYGRRKV